MLNRRWTRFFRQSPALDPGPAVPQTQGIHVNLLWTKEGERYLSHTSGDVTAEELCILAAETIGITPLCHVFFALYNPKTHCWYSPNHSFSPNNTNLVLQYRMRFYFRNWHGLNTKEPIVSRYGPKSVKTQAFSPLLELTSLEYLFVQATHDFVDDLIQMDEIKSEEKQSCFKNESLGMAVLHLSHLAIQRGCTLQEVAKKTSFLNCIPRSFAKHISSDNFLTKLRIQRVFDNFVQTFQQHTVEKEQMATQIMYKYISTLEHLAPHFGTETFIVTHLKVREDGSGTDAKGVSKEDFKTPVSFEVMVSGIKGIHWRKVMDAQRAQDSYLEKDHVNSTKNAIQPDKDTLNNWTSFCDFPEITHIVITDANVCISTLDNQCMEVHMSSRDEARSFIFLLDGYYRLTADAYHYLCQEVAPPRVVLSEANALHGPMHDDFVLQKLKKEAADIGTCLVRWSALDYHRIILVVLTNDKNGLPFGHKQFRIQQKGSMFCMEGWDKEFPNVKKLIDGLKTFVLKSGLDCITVKKCCLPRQGEISNLLVKRQGAEHPGPSNSLPSKLTEILRFYPIKDKDIVQEQHLGRGTRTNIYSGRLIQGIDDDLEFNNNSDNRKDTRVVLKILDQSQQHITLPFFEIASLMSQVSHSHLVFVHGVYVKGSENILVEEYVEFGPLDFFLLKNRDSVNAQWKLIVAKQLASALSYLETKRWVHGNVCAKNILVARDGLQHGTTPFVKLSDPGIALNVLTREERLERIPWIAPECIENSGPVRSSADAWSFGITLLEICNNGEIPMSGSSLSEKEYFYQKKGRLAEPTSQELAKLYCSCMTYDPEERPSFRTVLRELTDIMIKNPDIIPSNYTPTLDPGEFDKRYLKKIKLLGEGRFGKVTLCMYDPKNDGTGEYVAMKTLKQENGYVPGDWIKEINILKTLHHSNIVKYKGSCFERGRREVHLIMEFVPCKSLREYLPKNNFNTSQYLVFAQQICLGMDYLHSKRYLHRDLAARNVLVDKDDLVKIGDFGLTKYLPEGANYYRVNERGDSPVYWYAIECLKENKFSFASDVWSFGVTLYEILTRCENRQSPPVKFLEMLPSQEQMTPLMLLKLLEDGFRLPCPKDCPHLVKLLIDQCCHANPAQRPSFKELVEKLEGMIKIYLWDFPTNFSKIC